MKNLKTLLEYLSLLKFTDNKVITVVDDAHAVDSLKSVSGRQIIVSYPEMRQVGESSDGYNSELSAAIFVLEKVMSGQRTDELERTQYIDMLNTVGKITTALRNDTTGITECPLLFGMQIKTISVTPVYKVFGGWGGWLVAIEM